MMRPPERRGEIPLWLFVVAPGHHEGGIHDPYQYVTRRDGFRSEYERCGEPPAVDHVAHQRARGTYRATVVRTPPAMMRPPLNYPALPPPSVTRADRFGAWLERVIGWRGDLAP